MWRQRTLQYTRPNLVELKSSRDIIISNLTFKNSPFWNIHPVYCRYKLFMMYEKCLFYSYLIHSLLICILFPSFLPLFSNVVFNYLTIVAPADSPNTDGIDPGEPANAGLILTVSSITVIAQFIYLYQTYWCKKGSLDSVKVYPHNILSIFHYLNIMQ